MVTEIERERNRRWIRTLRLQNVIIWTTILVPLAVFLLFLLVAVIWVALG